MKRFSLLVMLMAVVLISAGCGRTQKVIATQDGFSAPHESLGGVEVSREAPMIQSKRLFGQLWQWATLGHYQNIAQEAYLQGLLNKKLIKAAKKTHQAEQVIDVKYWPELSAKKFPQGLIYAKGEMIRYKRFPE